MLKIILIYLINLLKRNGVEGLKRCLTELEQKGIVINSLTTDRHPQVEAEINVEA